MYTFFSMHWPLLCCADVVKQSVGVVRPQISLIATDHTVLAN